MRYVDGFVLVVPKKNLKAYVQMAQKAGKIWLEDVALEYRECVGDLLFISDQTAIDDEGRVVGVRNFDAQCYGFK